MANKQLYWKGEDELMRTPEFLAAQKNEFSEPLPLDEVLSENNLELSSNRRDFLKFFGFSVAAVSLAACNQTKVKHVVPYLVKPEEITPGVANYYNSTCGACSIGCGVTVKTREGRPIKVDGNYHSPISNGGLCASGQASILSLYDNDRLANPMKDGVDTDWKSVDEDIIKQLTAINAAGGKIALVSSTVHSPSALAVVRDFTTKYANTKHITHDAISMSGMLTANRDCFGKAVIPTYNFEKADVIVSFGADFLGTWISTVEYTDGYTKRRNPEGEMSQHFQFEANLSLTGSNADFRFPMKASNEAIYVMSLYNHIAQATGGKQLPTVKQGELAGGSIKAAADALLTRKGKGLVLSGSNDPKIQSVINGINLMLGNYSTTIDLDNHSNQYKGIDADFVQFVNELKGGQYQAVIFWNSNPVYNSPLSKDITEGLKKAKLSVSFASNKSDETAKLVQYVCPASHYLESWGDAEPRKGVFQLMQPTISPVFSTRQAEESLMAWAGIIGPEKDPFANKGILNHSAHTSTYYSYIKNNWKLMTGMSDAGFDGKFNEWLHDGVYPVKNSIPATTPALIADLGTMVSDLEATVGKADAVDLVLYQNVGVRNGDMGNNPWLQELPDPISKVTWDNYVSLPKALAEQKDIKNGDLVNISVGNTKLTDMPVFIQPGQSNQTVGLALGYGRDGKTGEKGVFEKIGQNAYPFMRYTNSTYQTVISGVNIEKTEGKYELAQTQTHNSIEGRDHVRETTWGEFKKPIKKKTEAPHLYTLWETHDYKKDGAPNHHWAMAIDLNACTGCGACIVSCHIENNVPVVGRAEVRRRREMHWLRIDRYFAFTNNDASYLDKNDRNYEEHYITKEKGLEALDKKEKSKGKGAEYLHYENVQVVHQPIMCQHCGNAPCETVCPVLATTHSTEGLNQMTYNRCIGTKYCANNCPYKVRRFNWFRYNDNDHFDFHFNNDLGKMVINPDVTVRTRGVMEKCSMCVQRIQAGKLQAKREKRKLNDGEIQMACQRTCSAGAIVFGDVNDPNSEVAKLFRNERSYRVLEELDVQSSVKYLNKVRNTDKIS